jgi:hypothetical protein
LNDLHYLVLGNDETPGPTVRAPRCAPRAGALYRARLLLAYTVPANAYLTLFDGGADVLLPSYVPTMLEIVARLDGSGLDIGYADETRFGEPSKFECHHAVVCRASAVQAIAWPDGCYHFETIAYALLRRRGDIHIDEIVYDWRPELASASKWGATTRGIVNSLMWARNGHPGVHFPSDFRDDN